jgi:GAF domain-containing protein
MAHTRRTSGSEVAAASAGDPLSAELLQSVVDVARAIFGAQASSVFLFDEAACELVFRAVSGKGQDFLVGRRFPASSGIAGWVTTSGEPIVVSDLSESAAFDRALADSTGYVPDALMAAPLAHGDRVLGVLEVLDPVPQSRSSLDELDLLAMFARQAAAALRVVIRREDAAHAPAPVLAPGQRATVARLAADLQELLENSEDEP